MTSAFRQAACRLPRLARLVLPAIAILTAIAPAAPDSAPVERSDMLARTPLAASEEASTSFRPEVRLRKLHLVRPDLIPYPIAYEVVC